MTRNLDISLLTLHLSARTELPSGATRAVDQQMSAVGRQTRCPRSHGQSRAESTTEAARRENSGGEPSNECGQWEQPRGCTASRNGSSKQQTHPVGTEGKADEKQHEAVANCRDKTRITKSLERPPAMCAMLSLGYLPFSVSVLRALLKTGYAGHWEEGCLVTFKWLRMQLRLLLSLQKGERQEGRRMSSQRDIQYVETLWDLLKHRAGQVEKGAEVQ